MNSIGPRGDLPIPPPARQPNPLPSALESGTDREYGVLLKESMELLKQAVDGGSREEFRFFTLPRLFEELVVAPQDRFEAPGEARL